MSYGEDRDRRDDLMRGNLEAMQKGIQNSRSGGNGSSYTKKQTATFCISFMAIVILILVILIVVVIESN